MLFDHYWSAESQKARLYRVFTEKTKDKKKNSLGENLVLLRGKRLYVERKATRILSMLLKGGILKEVSVGCPNGECACSICGETLVKSNGNREISICKKMTISKGENTFTMAKVCVGDLKNPKDAYEVSGFCAVRHKKKKAQA